MFEVCVILSSVEQFRPFTLLKNAECLQNLSV